jgi:predicted Zn-dependent protease
MTLKKSYARLTSMADSRRALPRRERRGTAAVSLDFGEQEAEFDLHLCGGVRGRLEAEILTRAPTSVKLNITLRAEDYGLRTVNSNGLDVGFERPLYVVNATAVAERNGRQYTATYNRTASKLQDFSEPRNSAEPRRTARIPVRSSAFPVGVLSCHSSE